MEGHDNVCCSLVVGEGLTEAERERERESCVAGREVLRT